MLVTLSPDVLISPEKTGTKTITGGNLANYGGNQTYNCWRIVTDENEIAETPLEGVSDGKHNTSKEQTLDLGQVDFIKPEFTYEYANTVIDHNKKKVTVVFDIADKYFNTSELTADTAASNITVKFEGKEATNATKELSKLSDITATVNGITKKVGEKYQLVVSNLDQGNGGDYSGIMTLVFPAGIVTDTSNNSSLAKTITIGVDNPKNDTDQDPTIVDVVDPIWKVENINIDKTNKKVTADVIATDKYLTGVENSTLTTDDIIVTVDGDTKANNVITKTLSEPTFSTNESTGLKEIKYTLTLENWEESARQSGKSFLEYSGNAKITIKAGTVTDSAVTKPSILFDSNGSNVDGLHIGDFVDYDAGTWTQDEINSIQTGLKTKLQTANGSTDIPSGNYQFGGFTAGSSRNGNASIWEDFASMMNAEPQYLKDKETGDEITGWRIFDIDGDSVTLISAGNPEDYSIGHENGYGYKSEYVLTGNVNSGWANGETYKKNYQNRDWSLYINQNQKAISAIPLTKSRLDSWYTKYTKTENADTDDMDTLRKICQEPYTKYQNIIINSPVYFLCTSSASSTSDNDGDMKTFVVDETKSSIGNTNEGVSAGIRMLVTLSSDVLFNSAKIGTKTLTGDGIEAYGKDQTYNCWSISTEEYDSSTQGISDGKTNSNKEQTLDLGQVDFIKPEFTYEYANTTIDHDKKKVTIVFDIADKYFNTSALTSDTTASNIKVNFEGKEATNATKEISKLSDITATVNGTTKKIGEKYQVVVSNLDQGSGGDYSGIMTLAFPAGIVIDTSNNSSLAKTITIGVDEPQGDTEQDPTIVDVVDPVWKVENVNIDKENKKVTADVIATDKYLTGVENSTLTTDDITITVDGDENANNVIKKTLSEPTFSGNNGTEKSPYIPTGYSHVAGTSLSNGYTIQDSKGNQYVWVEVPQTKDVYPTAGLNITEFSTDNYTKIENDLHTYTSTYRKASDYTDDNGSQDVTGLTDSQYTALKQKMLRSIYQNGGFYVGKYETGVEDAPRTSGSATTVPTQTPVIKQNAYPYNYVTSSQAQTLASGFASGLDGYTSSLMFGVQWDLVLKYLETKGATQTELNENSTAWGNYYNNLWNITNSSSKYSAKNSNWTSGAYGEKTSNTSILLSTGASDTFSKQGIYDLAGNVSEWTLEAYSYYGRAYRGDYYGSATRSIASGRNSYNSSTSNYAYIGFRTALYKDTAQDSGSEISGTGTNVATGTGTSTGLKEIRYKLTLDNWEEAAKQAEKNYYEYSGNTKLTIKEGTITDDTTGASGGISDGKHNSSKEQTFDLGKVDLLAPVIEKVSSDVDITAQTATLVFNVSDKYLNSSDAITSTDITILVNGTVSASVTKTLTRVAENDITESVDGIESVVSQQYKITVSGFTSNAEQVKIRFADGSVTDLNGNKNKQTDIAVYNVLRRTTEANSQDSFLWNRSIQRQNIENVTFEANIPNTVYNSITNEYVDEKAWDVSARQDKSIIAWYETNNDNGALKVHIGSNDEIFANRNSSNLFAYIGSADICTATDTITNIDLLNVSNVTNMDSMFCYTGYTAMTSLDLGDKFDTSNVTDMGDMFYYTGYKAMINFELGENFDTSNVIDMSYMFCNAGYTAMTDLNLRDKFNTSNVTNMNAMFSYTGHDAMTSFNMGDKFDTSNVTNMNSMFWSTGRNGITSLNLGDKFDTRNVTDMGQMFYYTGYNSTMTSLNLGDKFDTSNVTNMERMFFMTGTKSLTTLDLGPAFTKIADRNTNMFYSTGKDGLIISAPESIYKSKTSFKLSSGDTTTEEGTIAPDTGKTIEPKYKPEWTVTGTEIDKTNKALKINLKGSTNGNYTSEVTTGLSAEDISVWIDGTEVTGLSKVVTTANPETGVTVTQTVTITDFEEAVRQAGKNYKEWSGNITLKIAGRGESTDTYTANTLTDSYGNQSMSATDETGTWIDIDFKDETTSTANTNGKLFADFVSPAVMYEYANTVIDHDKKTVTVVFDITDKYFNTSSLSADTTASNITVDFEGKEAINATKALTKLSDITDTVDGTSKKIGEKYQLVVSNLDQGKGGDYSGIMKLAFQAGIATDLSNNSSLANTITIGVDEPKTDDESNNNGVIVDVVDPIWKIENVNIDKTNKKVTADLIATDKYLTGVENSTLTTDDITITVDDDENANNVITKKLSEPTFSENSETGLKEIKYQLTLENWKEDAKQEGKSFYEYSGTTEITIAEGTITDDTTGETEGTSDGKHNISKEQILDLGKIDVLSPVIERVSSEVDAIEKTATLIFNVSDKYLNSSDSITSAEITVLVNGVENTSVTKSLTRDAENDISATIDGTESVVSQQYKLVISGLAEKGEQVKVRFADGSVTDLNGNKNKQTDIAVYNVLRSVVASEAKATGAFLGNSSIQRQNIEDITFETNIPDTVYNVTTGEYIDTTAWDVSARQDKSIIAWYETSNDQGALKVHIGSDDEIFGNQDSSYLFAYIGYADICTATETITNIGLLNVSSVTDMRYMFYCTGYKVMTNLDLGDKFDTSNVTNMIWMFSSTGYTAMKNLNLGDKFDTSNVEDMVVMFGETGYTAMTNLELGDKFDTSKVKDMEGMFMCTGYTAMTSLDLGGKFDTSNVINMSGMFSQTGYTAMTGLNLGDKFDTLNVTNMMGMFYETGYTAMTSLELGDKFDTRKVTNMNSLFQGCGSTAMTTLNLGPKFVRIADDNTSMFENCGKSGAIINAPESIYKNRTSFKKSSTDISTTAGTIAVSSGRTINLKYKPEWTVTGTEIDKTNKALKINLKGSTNGNYTSEVTTGLSAEDISVWIDGTEVTGLSKVVTTANPETGVTVTQTVTITDFEEAVRQAGKNYKEWSGNITLKIAGRGESTDTYTANTLTDSYGNQSMSATDETGTWIDIDFKDETTSTANTNGKLFADFVSPAVIYEYANTTIDHDKKTVTIVFDITDKYFNTSSLSSDTTASKITVNFEGKEATKSTKALTKLSDITDTVDGESKKIGEKYQLIVSNLDQGYGGDYSGIMTLVFQAGIATDLSNNSNLDKTITIGVDEPKTDDESNNNGVIVDVVDPIWKIENVNIDKTNKKVTADLIATDKYLTGVKNSTLTTDDITLTVDGDTNANNVITKTLSEPTFSTNSSTGLKEIKYILTLENWEEATKQSGKSFLEYSGTTEITIAEGTITDDTTGTTEGTSDGKYNTSKEQTIEIGHVDVIKPRIEKATSVRDIEAKTETITFNVVDKYLDTTKALTADEIKVYVDGEESTELTKSLTRVTANDVSATVNGSTQVVSQQYQLVLSDFEKSRTTIDTDRNFVDWSGTVSIEIAEGAVKDKTSGGTVNTNDLGTIDADFVDFINPKITYKYTTSDIDYDNKKFTMTFDVTDKYYVKETEITTENFADYLTIKVDGEDITNNSKVTKKIILAEDITAGTTSRPINKTIDGTVKTGLTNQVVGKRYKLEISNLEQLIKTADYADYSGVITVAVKEGTAKDNGPSGDGKNPNENVTTTITSGVDIPDGTGTGTVVDVVDPIWEKVAVSEVEPESRRASLVIRGTDKYFASSSLTNDKIKIIVNGVEQTSGITVELTEDTSVKLDYGVQYNVKITGFVSNAYQVKMIIPEGTLTDKSGNTNKETEILLLSSLRKTNTETDETSPFLGNTAVERQKVEKVIFKNNLDGVNDTRWDVSAQEDGSIIAWYEKNNKGLFTVYIGSYSSMNANTDSSYLFANIGKDTNCAVTGDTEATDGTERPLIENLDLLNVEFTTNMEAMFMNFGYSTMKSFNLDDKFKTSNVTNMNHMFDGTGYTAMTSFELGGNFDTSNVTDMSYMFANIGNEALTDLNLGDNFNTSKVTNMNGMFSQAASKLTSLVLGDQFDTSNVTNMSSMFASLGYQGMTSLSLGNKFNTGKATDMSNMFYKTGSSSMATLDLGPTFTKIAGVNTGMFEETGKSSGTVIYVPESIYKSRTSVKLSSTDTTTAEGAIAVSNGRTVEPKYKPEWTVTKATLDTANKAISIQIKGSVNSSNYTSDVTTALDEDGISVWFDGIEAKTVSKSVTTANPSTGEAVTHTVTITDFEEDLRQIGKSYKEWSGNFALKIAGRGEKTSTYTANVLTDSYGNQNMSEIDTSGTWVNVELKDEIPSTANTDGKMFADFIDPEFTYKYANTVIDHDTKTVTVVFDVADKYFASSTLSTDTNASKINVVFEGTEATKATKSLKKISDITEEVDGSSKTIGERYQLEVSNLDQGGGGDYSGIMTLSFDDGVITDTSGNESLAKTITIGIDNPSTDDGNDTGVIVDVVDPIWKIENININSASKKVTADLIATDKYLTGVENSTLTPEDITITVDGDENANKAITKTLSEPTFSENAETGLKEIKYILTLDNWEEAEKQEGKNFLEYSGTTKITIAEGTVEDDTSQANGISDGKHNHNKEQTFEIGHVDFIKPRVEKVSSVRDTTAKTETITFNVVDKYLDTTKILTADEIKVYVDGEEATTLSKVLTRIAANDVSAIVNGSTQVVSQQYQLVISNFEKASIDVNKDFLDWSGTVTIEVAEGAAKDKEKEIENIGTSGGNINDATTIKGDFVDYIKPSLKYEHQDVDIDKAGKTYSMTFTVTDKYYKSGQIGIDDLTIKMQNGQLDSDGNEIIYNLKDQEGIGIALRAEEKTSQDIQITNTKTGEVETSSELIIGHTYTLTISHLEQLEVKDGATTADYSGIITVEVDADKVLDKGPSGNGTSSNGNVATTITSGANIPGGTIPDDAQVVDVVDPIWQKVTSSASAIDPINKESSTATVKFRGTDAYFANSTLTENQIKVLVNGGEVTTGITKTLSEATKLNEQRKSFGSDTITTKQYGVEYTLTLSGFAQDASQVKVQIPAGCLNDEYGNSNKVTDLIVYNTLRSTASEGDRRSAFLGNSAIQRRNIENVTFERSIPNTVYNAETDEYVDTTAWDVSAIHDKSIIAWYETSNDQGALKVHIGSNDEIFANQDSEWLFAGIGEADICTATETITNIDLLNVGSVTNMDAMFHETGYTAMTSLDLGDKFDTSNVTDMSTMFFETGYKVMTSLDLGEKFDTSNVTNMETMFQETGYMAMTSLDLGDKFDTSNVTNMFYMFCDTGYTAMTSLKLGEKFNTSNVTNMEEMFARTGYTAMTSLNLGDKFNTNKVTNMGGMFEDTGHTAMTSLNLGDKFDTSNVTDMRAMFAGTGYTAMTSLDLGEKFDTRKVTDMTYMFIECGAMSMITLNLGPAFTRIPTQSTDFMTDCGTTGLVIYAPESIYANNGEFYISETSNEP